MTPDTWVSQDPKPQGVSVQFNPTLSCSVDGFTPNSSASEIHVQSLTLILDGFFYLSLKKTKKKNKLLLGFGVLDSSILTLLQGVMHHIYD